MAVERGLLGELGYRELGYRESYRKSWTMGRAGLHCVRAVMAVERGL
jgi:hypothetical protein